MWNWIKRIFAKPINISCGGHAECVLVDRLGRTCGRVFYRRPTSDEKLSHYYDMRCALSDKAQLKEVQGESTSKTMLNCHKVVVNKLSIPYAEKIFLGSEGIPDGNGKVMDDMSVEKQFELIKTYRSHILVDLVAVAYPEEVNLKKKS